MPYEVDRVLIGRDRIRERVRELSRDFVRDLRPASDDGESDAGVVLIPVLAGAMVFASDLVRELPMRLSVRMVAVSSYPGESVRSKGAKLRGAIPHDLRGRHVVIVDDILDSGQTLSLLREAIAEQRPASLQSIMLLRKDVPRATDVYAEYVGFDIPDEFVVGYGLDFNGLYRNLPDIVTLRESGA